MRLLLLPLSNGGRDHWCRETGDQLVTNCDGKIRRPAMGHGHYHKTITGEEILHEFDLREWMEV